MSKRPKHPTSPDAEFLTTTASDLRTKAVACRIAGGTTACRRLDAAAELLAPPTPDPATEEAPAPRRRAAKPPVPTAPSTATVAEPGATRRRRDLDDEVEAGDEDDLDGDGEE